MPKDTTLPLDLTPRERRAAEQVAIDYGMPSEMGVEFILSWKVELREYDRTGQWRNARRH